MKECPEETIRILLLMEGEVSDQHGHMNFAESCSKMCEGDDK